MNGAVDVNADGVSEQNGGRVRQQPGSLGGVAGRATVKQVVVVGHPLGVERDRKEMVDLKGRCRRHPPFPLQTVDAPEGVLVAEPWAIAFVVRIAARAVATLEGCDRVLERDGHALGPDSAACARFNNSWWSLRAYSSGSGATRSRWRNICCCRSASSAVSSGVNVPAILRSTSSQ